MNLIQDAWIPVSTLDGLRRIRPDQIADAGVLRPAWPRPDLNVACYELLIGLAYLADPPADPADWRARSPDPARLADRLAPFAFAFELLGDGPRFLQDLEPLAGEALSADALFIDSAGAKTRKDNADLMVRSGRYVALPADLAAMALYAMQAFAPVGGAGIRASMRGGGPMVTLVEPILESDPAPLWSMVWANTPCGAPTPARDAAKVLPWLRPTRESSGKGSETYPAGGAAPPVECFFGMPRRLRLLPDGDGGVTGLVQRPHGTHYAGWVHPLTPYYRAKPADPPLPMHPQPGGFGYRNWIGPVLADARGLRTPASTVTDSALRVEEATLLIAGWDMDNMKPRDFLLSRQPRISLDIDAHDRVLGMIAAAECAGKALAAALMTIAGTETVKGVRVEALREDFFASTQDAFEARVRAVTQGADHATVCVGWRDDLRRAALRIVDWEARSGIETLRPEKVAERLAARRNVLNAFAGRTKLGAEMFQALGLTPPPKVRPKAGETVG